MKDTALFAQLLGISAPWCVTEVAPDLDSKSISIRIEWPDGKPGACPECGELCGVYDHREEREWRHLDTMQFKTLLICPVPRVNCKTHGVKSLKVPWADLKCRFTMLFERFAIDVLLSASSKAKAAELLGLSWDEVHHIQERAVKRGLSRRSLEGIKHIGIDEKSFLKGQSYASVLYDLDGSRVVEVMQERTQEAATALLGSLPIDVRESVEAVAVDMWDPFLAAIKATLPDAEIVHDKYHLVSYLTKAVDEVRRKEHKMLKLDDQGELLKGTRYTWLRNPENWTEKDETTFKELKNKGLKVGRAWAIKETFMDIWEYTYEQSARKFFDNWYWWATHSRLAPIIKVAKTMKRHLDNILTYLRHRITNAKAEGFNSKIQAIKSAARGFRNFANYRVAILFHCGRLELRP
jgi:transposase